MSDEHTVQLQKDLIKGLIAQARLAAIDECMAVCGEYCCGDKNLEKMLTEIESLKEKPE